MTMENVSATPYSVTYKASDGTDHTVDISYNPSRFVPEPIGEEQILAALQWYVDDIYKMHAPAIIINAEMKGQAWRVLGHVRTTPLPELRKVK